MRKIYIGFSYPRHFKIGAYAIKKWMNKSYSHVYIRFDSNGGIPSTVYHAAHGMVHFREFEKFINENYVIKEYEIELPEMDRKDTLIHCIKLSGEKYGTVDLSKIVLCDVAHALGCKIEPKNSKGYICSELVGTIMCEKLNATFCKPLNLIKPNDIEYKLVQMGYKASE